MPYHIAYALKTDSIGAVSTAIEASTQCNRQGHESSYLGVYDLFQIPEDPMVKYNFVEEEDEWDYPDHKNRDVLVIAPQTDRPDHIANLVMGLDIDAVLVERKKW